MTQSEWIEQAARIIQPITFRSYDDLVAYCLRNGDGIETATRFADRTYGDDMVNARAKAAALYPLVQQAVAAEREALSKWLRYDADLTERESTKIIANTSGNPRKLFAEWQMLISVKRGLADAIERGEDAAIRQMKDTAPE